MIIMHPSIRMYYWRAALLQIEIVTQKISFWLLRNPQLVWFLQYINNKMNWGGFGLSFKPLAGLIPLHSRLSRCRHSKVVEYIKNIISLKNFHH